MREELLSNLVKEVLGPRDGPYEIITGNPRDEYITGVLSPRESTMERDVNSEAELPEVLISDDDSEDETNESEYSAPLFSPILNPQALPHSMGVTINIACSATPIISLCITWARYFSDNPGQRIRQPRAFVLESILAPVYELTK